MNADQYKILSARQIAQNTMIWQTPTLAMAAQAFLLATAFNPQTERTVGLVLSVFSFLVGLASIQLITKHRFIEELASRKMEEFEIASANEGYSIIHRRYTKDELERGGWVARISSFQLWRGVLGGFCLMASYAFVTKFLDP